MCVVLSELGSDSESESDSCWDTAEEADEPEFDVGVPRGGAKDMEKAVVVRGMLIESCDVRRCIENGGGSIGGRDGSKGAAFAGPGLRRFGEVREWWFLWSPL